MSRRFEETRSRLELHRVIRRVRRRWRLKLVLRGVALAGLAAVVATTVTVVALDRFAAAPPAVLASRIGLGVALLAAVGWLLVRPLLRRVTDERVALYLEEHEPSLEAAVLSAVEATADPGESDRAAGHASPALVRRTIETAIERCRAVEDGRFVEASAFRRYIAALAGVAVVAAALGLFGPQSVRDGAVMLVSPSSGAAAEATMRLVVQPGDTTVARGADQAIAATTEGFAPPYVEVALRSASDSVFERVPMAAGEAPGRYGFLLFDLDEDTEYFVEADGIRSAIHRIRVAELPYVDRIDLEYRYPAYTGLASRTVDDGGDVAAIEGTVVHLRVRPTLPVPGGRVVFDDGRTIALERSDDGTLAGTLRVERRGLYHVEFDDGAGGSLVGSPEYIVDVLSDLPPTVSFSEPGRDVTANPIEEVFVDAEAADDYGIASLELVYSVNGAPEDTVALYDADRALREVSAGHAFFLEEFGLEPGDFVAYYARAVDNDAVGGAKSTTSDIYFLEILPFGREYRQADQAGGAGAGGGQPGNGLSERQRRIVAATFNIARDSADYDGDTFDENVASVRLAQDRLSDEARTLARRMVMRGVTADSAFRVIAELLPRAADEMDDAVSHLRRGRPTDALPPEQRALRHLQRAEAVFREVTVGQGGRQGGAGGGPTAEELADLFELELDQERNRYETLQRGTAEGGSRELDETAERLRELARRQQQENERLRRRAMAGAGGQQAGADGSAAGQRELAEQVEEEARRLERLSREQSRPELMESARRLREAADAMRRAAANGSSGAADANAARERLEEARRLLERSRGAGLERDARGALERAERLVREQAEIGPEMRELNESDGNAPDRGERARELIERKDAQADEVVDLEQELHRLAAGARGEQDAAARELREAAAGIRDDQIEAKIRYSRRMTDPRAPAEYVRELEAQIEADLDALRRRLGEAVDAFVAPPADSTAETLRRARDLARDVESLRERLQRMGDAGDAGARTAARRDRSGQPGQRGGRAGEPAGRGDGRRAPGAGGDRSGTGGAHGGFGPSGAGGGDGPDRPGQIRQLRRELQARIGAAEALRERLRRDGRDTDDLDRVIRGLRRLGDADVYDDPTELERLRTSISEDMKRFEYALREELGGEERARLFLSGSGEVPEGFRELVEAYYRALAEGPPR